MSLLIHDIRNQLIRSKTVPQVLRPVTRNVTLHWNGDSIGDASDIDLLKSDARYHVFTKGWDGISYHYGVGRELEADTTRTRIYRNRDYNAKLAHSGVTQGNNESLSVLVLTGDGDKIAPEQYAGLYELLKTLDIQPRYILGHQEWPRSTACPGALINRWVAQFRTHFSDGHLSEVAVTVPVANIRDESNVLSLKLGVTTAGKRLVGRWVLGKPVKGDCLWLECRGIAPDNDALQYVHGSALDSSSYSKRVW